MKDNILATRPVTLKMKSELMDAVHETIHDLKKVNNLNQTLIVDTSQILEDTEKATQISSKLKDKAKSKIPLKNINTGPQILDQRSDLNVPSAENKEVKEAIKMLNNNEIKALKVSTKQTNLDSLFHKKKLRLADEENKTSGKFYPYGGYHHTTYDQHAYHNYGGDSVTTITTTHRRSHNQVIYSAIGAVLFFMCIAILIGYILKSPSSSGSDDDAFWGKCIALVCLCKILEWL